MSRTGFLVVGALIFALAAAGVLVWTNVLEYSGEPASSTQAVALSDTELQAVGSMKQAATTGGFAATFSGREGRTWELAAGHRVERFALSGGEDILARLVSSVPLDKDHVVDGLFVELPVEFSQLSNGKRIEVGVVARSGHSNPSAELSLLYATRQAGNSGWKTLKLSPVFELRTISFDVPTVADGYSAKPVIAVRGDTAGQGLAVELLGVYAKIVPQEASPSEAQHAFVVDFSKKQAEWIVPEGHKLSIVEGTAIGRLTSSRVLVSKSADLGSQGASVLVPVEVVQQFNGKRIEIAVHAKATNAESGQKLWLVFATQQAGNSGWRSIWLSPELQEYRIAYDVPAVPTGYTNPSLLVVQADESGTGKSADIQSITIDLADE